MAKRTVIIATVTRVDDHGAYAETKSVNDKARQGEEQPDLWGGYWGIPKELGATVHDDIVITLTADATEFISYRNASTGKLYRLR